MENNKITNYENAITDSMLTIVKVADLNVKMIDYIILLNNSVDLKDSLVALTEDDLKLFKDLKAQNEKCASFVVDIAKHQISLKDYKKKNS